MVVIVIILVLPLIVLAYAKCCKDNEMNEKIEAIKKLIEVQNVLLHDLSTMIETCDEGGQGE